jgi:acyl-CoA thioester hydrolase
MSEGFEGGFALALEVRDYELDLQGIVNNANYFHYYEHARHAFIKAKGLAFAALHEAGLDPVVYHAEIDYREALHSGDSFVVFVKVRKEGRLKLVFDQAIVKSDGHEASRASFVVAMVGKGRPVPVPDSLLSGLGLD